MFKGKTEIPTDLEILEYIYQAYYKDYNTYNDDADVRQSKIFVPIDCQKIAKHFGVDKDIIFGRLYYHLENKYGYRRDDTEGSIVHFFYFELSKSINFPYLASVLADLKDQDNRFNRTRKISLYALFIAAVSLSVTLFDKVVTSAPVTDTEKVSLSVPAGKTTPFSNTE